MPDHDAGLLTHADFRRFASLRFRIAALMLLTSIAVVLTIALPGSVDLPDETLFARVDAVFDTNLAGSVLIAVLAVGSVWIIVERFVLRRVEALARIAEQFEAGDLSQRAEPDGADEIGVLARSFNATANRLADLLAVQEQAAAAPAIELDEVVLRRMFEMGLLNQFAGALQACVSPDEAFAMIPDLTSQLLPEYAGAVYLIRESRDAVEAKATWGPMPASAAEPFAPQKCRALRDGRLYSVADYRSTTPCEHLAGESGGPYLCIPLITHGDTLGVLHLRRTQPVAEHEQDVLGETGHALAEAVADHISLNLGNLRLREMLRSQSIHDPLTGLFNRRYLEESMARELSRAARDRYPVGVIMLDIDHFKQFNDTSGHDAGDAVLREVGELLRTGIRGGDIACRYGGEEFIAILPGAPIDATRWRAEQLRASIERRRVTYRDGLLEPVTVSLGIAVYPEHGDTYEDLVRSADAALYLAKRDGRNRVSVAAAADGAGTESLPPAYAQP